MRQLAPTIAPPIGRCLIPVLVFGFGLLATVAGWYVADTVTDEHARQRFAIDSEHLKHEVADRITPYENLLLGAAALFNASEEVSRKEWDYFVSTLNLDERLPGTQGIGFAVALQPDDVDAHVDAVRAEGFTDYSISPVGSREVYTPILYIEPFDWRNRRAFGFDMFSEPTRREAMERARDTGAPAMTGKVELVQETDEDKQAGFLLYFPVYSAGAATKTVADRRQALVGYVYSPFRADNLMRGILNDQLSTVNFRIYDGNGTSVEALLYDGNIDLTTASIPDDAPRYTGTSLIEIAGHSWTLEFFSTPVLEGLHDRLFPLSIAAGGLLLSILLGVIAAMLASSQSRVDARTAELRNQELLNTRLLENLSDGVVACDGGGQLTLFNKTARDWHGGMDPREMPQEEWAEYYDLYHGDGVTRLEFDEIPLVRALNGELLSNIEMSIVTKGDKPRFLRVSGSPLQSESGKTMGAVAVMRDVTEERRNAQHVANLFEFAPDAIVMIDDTGTIVQVNARVEALFGWTREELVGQPVETLMPEEFRAGHGKLRNAFMQTATHRVIGGDLGNLRALRKCGEIFPVDISISPMETEDGLLFAASIRDTSDRVQAEQAMREAMTLLDATVDGAFVFDPESLRFSFVNEGAVQQLGYTRDELLTMSIEDIAPELNDTKLQEALPPLLRGECHSLQLDTLHRHKDGHDIPVDVALQYVAQSGQPVKCIAMVRDVTDRQRAMRKLKKTASELRQANLLIERERERLAQRVADRTAVLTATNEKLEQATLEAEQASRAKSSFLAAMSHEIRTPMNGVIGMVEVLAQSRLDAEQSEAVKTVQKSAFALLALIDDVLDFSKIEAGRLELERAPVVLAELVDQSCASLTQLAEHKNVDLTLYIEPQTPCEVWSDATRLRQVLNNLVGNAIKFSSGRPEIRGRVSVRVEVSNTTSPCIAFVVEDNGIGMTPDTVVRLFDSFSQAETSTTRRFGGSGLGLAICKRLVDLMGGEIGVTSMPGAGSTFTVTLPVDVVAESTACALQDLSGLDCIVVPGAFASADELRAYLEPVGARVQVAQDIRQAKELAEELALSVVIVQEFARKNVSLRPVKLRQISAVAVDARVLLLTWNKHRRTRVTDANLVTHNGSRLQQYSFLRAVAIAAGRASPEDFIDASEQSSPQYREPAPSIAEAREQGRLILVAEDDSTNQKVILRQLELLGYAAEIAADGGEALALWRSNRRYALLLSDLHMPIMDGYELAETIRREEADGERMPIVALTANALRGEAERSSKVGMDEYLTKPVQLRSLEASLLKWVRSRDPVIDADDDREPAVNGATAVPADAVDISILTDLVGDDEETIRELLSDYLLAARDVAAGLLAARKAEDRNQIKAQAHKLKSSSRAVGALALGDLCAELENACSAADSDGINRCVAEFENHLASVENEISVRLSERPIGANLG